MARGVVACLLLLFAGCAVAARPESMMAPIELLAPAVLRDQIAIGDATRSRNARAPANSKVSSFELRRALQRSLDAAGYGHPDPAIAPLSVVAHVLALDSSDAADGTIVTSRVRYVLERRADGGRLMDDVAAMRCTVSRADSPVPSGRLERATECSVAKNVAAFLWRLRALSLEPPLGVEPPSEDRAGLGGTPAPELARSYLAARGDTGRLAALHGEALRRGAPQIAGAFALTTSAGCQQPGRARQRAWIEQRGPAILFDAGDGQLDEGVVVENTVVLVRADGGAERWLVGTVSAERIELTARDCTLTLTSTR
jgi:hypothetical protein